MLIISADAMMGRYMIVMGRWDYIFGHRPTGDVPGIPDGQSAPALNLSCLCCSCLHWCKEDIFIATVGADIGIDIQAAIQVVLNVVKACGKILFFFKIISSSHSF